MTIKTLGVERKATPISNILYHLEMTCYQLLRLFPDSLKIKGACDLGSTAGVCDHFVTSAAMHCQTSTRENHLCLF